MLITGGLVMNTRSPGTAASFRVSDCATASASSGRWPRSFRWMNSRP